MTRARRSERVGTRLAASPAPANLYFTNHGRAAINRSAETHLHSPSTITTASQPLGIERRTAPYPMFARAELDLLMAEGYIRKSDFTNAMAKINITRVAKGGLPPLAGITSADAADRNVVGGRQLRSARSSAAELHHGRLRQHHGSDEVGKAHGDERTSTGAHGSSTAAVGVTWPRERHSSIPTPYNELQLYNKVPYSLGGVGGKDAAAKGTYGY